MGRDLSGNAILAWAQGATESRFLRERWPRHETQAASSDVRENRRLTPEEQDVEGRAFDNLNRNLPALAKEYEEKFGNEVSTDNAREIVSPEYAASREARTRWSEATQRPAGKLSDYLFEQALQHVDPNKRRVVVMTAGGTGAGKTTALSGNLEFSNVQFVYDSNLNSRKSSERKIEAAKAAGNRVEIRFVHRDPVEAFTGGVLPRAMAGGASCRWRPTPACIAIRPRTSGI
jgi:hypothetical protein